MTEFWEENFRENKTMWGFNPSDTAVMVKDFFLKNNIKNILIPGVGYGRNAKVFIDNGIKVTGIEISKTAIELAKENGINMYFYDADSIKEDFGKYGLEEFKEIEDPNKATPNKRSIKFTMIKCRK